MDKDGRKVYLAGTPQLGKIYHDLKSGIYAPDTTAMIMCFPKPTGGKIESRSYIVRMPHPDNIVYSLDKMKNEHLSLSNPANPIKELHVKLVNGSPIYQETSAGRKRVDALALIGLPTVDEIVRKACDYESSKVTVLTRESLTDFLGQICEELFKQSYLKK